MALQSKNDTCKIQYTVLNIPNFLFSKFMQMLLLLLLHQQAPDSAKIVCQPFIDVLPGKL